MKKFTQRELAKMYNVPNKTLSNWAKSGKFVPAEYNGARKPCFYHEDQLPQLEELMKAWKPKHNKPAQILSEPQPDSETAPAAEHSTNHEHHDDTITPVEAAPVVEVVVTLADRANRIRKLQADVQRGIIKIGEELIAAKEEVGHGNWSAWLEKEFSWTQQTANRFMRVAERFGKLNIDVQFKPTTLIQMLALPEGTEQEFIAAQAEQGTPVETQSAREVQKNVKQFKQRRAAKKDSDNTEPVDELQPVRADMDAEEHEDREVDSENTPAADTLPAQMNEPTEDNNVVATPAQVAAILKLIDETDDDQQLNSLKIALTDAIILIDAKRAVLAKK